MGHTPHSQSCHCKVRVLVVFANLLLASPSKLVDGCAVHFSAYCTTHMLCLVHILVVTVMRYAVLQYPMTC